MFFVCEIFCSAYAGVREGAFRVVGGGYFAGEEFAPLDRGGLDIDANLLDKVDD